MPGMCVTCATWISMRELDAPFAKWMLHSQSGQVIVLNMRKVDISCVKRIYSNFLKFKRVKPFSCFFASSFLYPLALTSDF